MQRSFIFLKGSLKPDLLFMKSFLLILEFSLHSLLTLCLLDAQSDPRLFKIALLLFAALKKCQIESIVYF